MRIEITLSPQALKFVRKLLQALRLKRLLTWWRKIEKRHWATRGLIKGHSTQSGMPDFTILISKGEKWKAQILYPVQ